jgi:uncharacterized protein YwqG
MDKCLADVIWTAAREQGTPDSVVEVVLKNMLPSIRLVPRHPGVGEDGRIGACRIGGVPDLPPGVEWPRLSPDARSDDELYGSQGTPLSFLLQINLAEVAFADLENLLPKSGMLYFFFYFEEDILEYHGPVLFTQRTDLQRAAVPPDLPADEIYRCFNLVPELEWTVPTPEDLGLNDHFELWDELEDKVAAAQGYESPTTYGPGYAVHRMLGHPQFIQSGSSAGETLLLQVSSDAGLSKQGYPESGIGESWHDCERIYYLIKEEALKAHRFKEIVVSVECA